MILNFDLITGGIVAGIGGTFASCMTLAKNIQATLQTPTATLGDWVSAIIGPAGALVICIGAIGYLVQRDKDQRKQIKEMQDERVKFLEDQLKDKT